MTAIEASSGGSHVSIARSVALIVSAMVVVMSFAVLLGGWIVGSEALVRIRSFFVAMVPSTALCFILTGGSLFWWLRANGESHRAARALRVVAAVVAAISLLDLWVIFSQTAVSVDELFLPSFPVGRDAMSPATAFCFVLAAACLAMIPGTNGKSDFQFAVCATIGLLLSMIAAIGYAFDAQALYSVTIFTAMALHTAVGFMLLFAALLLTRPERSWVWLVLGPKAGSAGARRLLPVSILVPFFFGLAALAAAKAQIIELNFSFSILALLTIVLLVMSVLHNARVENAAEQRLLSAVDELNIAVADRDLMLRELYHRVKNNLQQINALIHLETAKISDPRAKAAFRATAGRVNALGTVHRLLISSPSISQINTAVFLEDLCENIGASFNARGLGITIHVEAEDIPISIDSAIPIGMLVNELVTNALKHAFRGRSVGEILVRFTMRDDGGADLEVMDNGTGIPPAKLDVPSSDGNGSRIIRSFVKQLRGDMQIDVAQGTNVTIQMPRSFNRRSAYA